MRLASLALLLACTPVFAQPTPEQPIPPPGDGERLFGMEFEFAGNGNRVLHFEEMPFENYEKLMRVIVEHNGGNPADIRKVTFMKESSNLERYPTGERELFRAEWVDARGRKWMIEPEFVASTGYDGYELVTPPLDDTRDLEQTPREDQGLQRRARRPEVRRAPQHRRPPAGRSQRQRARLGQPHHAPREHGAHAATPVQSRCAAAATPTASPAPWPSTTPTCCAEIDALPPEERTRARLEELFAAREGT